MCFRSNLGSHLLWLKTNWYGVILHISCVYIRWPISVLEGVCIMTMRNTCIQDDPVTDGRGRNLGA